MTVESLEQKLLKHDPQYERGSTWNEIQSSSKGEKRSKTGSNQNQRIASPFSTKMRLSSNRGPSQLGLAYATNASVQGPPSEPHTPVSAFQTQSMNPSIVHRIQASPQQRFVRSTRADPQPLTINVTNSTPSPQPDQQLPLSSPLNPINTSLPIEVPGYNTPTSAQLTTTSFV